MIQDSTIFTGCSFTAGIGLPQTSSDSNLWVNRLYNSSDRLSNTKLVNLGLGGNSNAEIFQQSVNAISLYNCKYLFVAWTSLYRYKFSWGAELHKTNIFWSPISDVSHDLRILPDIVYSKKYLNDLKNRFFDLHHDHAEIVKVLNYTSIINRLCQKVGTEVYFINNILPWDQKFFDQITIKNRLPSDTTLYTQKLLNVTSRNDSDFFEIYDKIHAEYYSTGGVHECKWLNLDFGFWLNFCVDVGNDNLHPGIQSHRKFGDYLIVKFADHIHNLNTNK